LDGFSNTGIDPISSTSYQTKPTHYLHGDHKVKRISWTIAAALVVGLFLPVNAAQADPWTTTGYSGAGSRFMAVDRAGNLYIANYSSNTVTKITPAGVATQCGETGLTPRGIAIDASGNIYTSNTGDNTVTKITPTCEFKKDFGLTGSTPFNLAIDQAGNIYTANYGSDNVSKITPAGVSIQDYVYLGAHTSPSGITIDQAGNLYVSNCGPHDIKNFSPIDDVRKITPERVVTIVGTTGQCPGPLVFDSSGNIYTSNQASTFVSKITPAGVSTNEFAPTGGTLPYSLAIDPLGNIYVTNALSNNIGKITPSGDSSILGTTGNSGPRGIIYSSGNIYAVNVDGTLNKFSLTTATPGTAPNSQVATISTGVTGVIIPSTAALPATTLKFGGAVPTAVTVVPVATNPAPASATPFTISGSTKIVDIQITGTFNGSATVCLDGNSTDHLFHYVGGKWEELPSRTYANGQVCGVTTSFSPFAAAPVPAAPVVVYVPPTPVPYLKTLTNPQIHLVGDKFVCTAGTYNSGYTLDGVIQGSATALYTPASYTFNLLFNQVAQTALAVTAAKNSAAWGLSSAPAGALVSCSVTVTANSLKNTDSTTANPASVSAALTTQSQSASAAESTYNAAVSANSKSYQKALVDNRAAWRANVDKVRTAYFAELTRINGLPYSKANSDLKSAALKAYLAAQKKTAVDYKASGPAALVVRDLANKAALDTKTAAIVKANSVYGAFIESIGYGVLVP
jgi:streptogramin lyase